MRQMGTPRIKTIKALFTFSGNRCYFPDCDHKLVDEKNNIIGQISHIKGNNPKSRRYDNNQPEEERQDIRNLMLFCPTHHRIVDTNEDVYTVELLLSWKSDHENKVESVQEISDELASKFLFRDKMEECLEIHENSLKLFTGETMLIINLFPLNTLGNEEFLPLSEIKKHKKTIKPLRCHFKTDRIISNSYIVSHSSTTGDNLVSSVSVRKDCLIEIVDDHLLQPIDNELLIYNPFYENEIIQIISTYLKLYETIGIQPPIVILISLVGIAGFKIKVQIQNKLFVQAIEDRYKILENRISSSEIIIDDFNEDIEESLTPFFTKIWNASNYLGRPDYTAENLWEKYE